MLIVRIYALVCLLAAAAAGVLVFLTGFSNEFTQMILGLIGATLFFAGIVMVLPIWVNEHFAPKNR